MADVSDLHNTMYKDQYDHGLPKPIYYLIKNFSKPRYEIINEYLDESDTLLDLGCGTGHLCQVAATKFKTVHGLDFAPESIESAKKLNIDNANFAVFDLNQSPLPFDDNSIDTITSVVTLDYVYNLNTLVGEINRILKPGGKFVFQVNNVAFLPRRLNLLFGRYPKISSVSLDEWQRVGWDASACHLFAKKELKLFLASFGLKTLKITGSGIFRQFRRWWPSLLCGDLIFICQKTS